MKRGFKLVLCAVLSVLAVSSFTVSAEEAETSEAETEAVTTAVQTEAVTETVTETTVTTSVSETTATTAEPTPSYYDEILAYVGDDNAPVLNNNLQNDAIAIDKSTIDYSDKSMYTITTRSGDVFYLIINSSDGSVYFLNAVDTADLTSMLSGSSSSGDKQNSDAIEAMNQAVTEVTDESGSITAETKAADKNDKKSMVSSAVKSNVFVLIIGAVIIGIITVIVILKKRSDKQNSYDYEGYEDDDTPYPNVVEYKDKPEEKAENNQEQPKEEQSEDEEEIINLDE